MRNRLVRLTVTATLLTAALLTLGRNARADNPDAILGQWVTAEGKSHVDIYKNKTTYYVKIIWLKVPNDTDGKPKIDKHNPDEKLQARKVIGACIGTSFTYDGDNTWSGGRIYDPETGKTYKGKMTLTNANTLDLRGYVGIPAFGRTETWTRLKK